MKKFLICLTVLLMAGTVFALPFYNSNQVALEWTAVTTDADGDTITGVTYQLYLANADTDPDKANPVIALGGITATQAIITLGTKGRYFVGVSALLDDLECVINWADELENQEGNELFALRFAVPPHAPKNIRK